MTLTEDSDHTYAPPPLRWLNITGIAGQDNIGIAPIGRLVVSDTALNILHAANIDHCDIEKFNT